MVCCESSLPQKKAPNFWNCCATEHRKRWLTRREWREPARRRDDGRTPRILPVGYCRNANGVENIPPRGPLIWPHTGRRGGQMIGSWLVVWNTESISIIVPCAPLGSKKEEHKRHNICPKDLGCSFVMSKLLFLSCGEQTVHYCIYRHSWCRCVLLVVPVHTMLSLQPGTVPGLTPHLLASNSFWINEEEVTNRLPMFFFCSRESTKRYILQRDSSSTSSYNPIPPSWTKHWW